MTFSQKTDVALKQWATRIGGLKGRASKLHPIEKRVKTLKGWEPAVVMADYEDDQVSFYIYILTYAYRP